MSDQTLPRFNIAGIFTDRVNRCGSLCLKEADGVEIFWWLPYVLERADQIDGWDWLIAEVEAGHIRLQKEDSEIWAHWVEARGATHHG